MKSLTARLCQAAIVLVGLGAFAFLLGEPHFEGRNAHATILEIYFRDPFLAYVYVGSIPFFVALHRAFALFGDAGRTGMFSRGTVDALRSIKRCALALTGFVTGAVVSILLFGDGEDRPPGIVMGLLALFASGTVAAVASLLGRNLEASLGWEAKDRTPRG